MKRKKSQNGFREHLFIYIQQRPKFLWERIGVKSYFFSSIFFAFLEIVIIGHNPEYPRVYLRLYALRFFFILVASFFNWIRHSPRYYFAGFAEMSEETFWRIILLLMPLLRIPFASHSQFEGTVFDSIYMKLFESLLSVFIIIQLLINYHNQSWALKNAKSTQKRIEDLRRKAKLRPYELELIKPDLEAHGGQLETMPLSWKFVKWSVTIFLAILISAYAEMTIDYFSQLLGIEWQHILFP